MYTDQETSRVTVLTGGVVVSGFAGGCNPDGMGPCEGAASRELFAGQRGQLLQVKRGDRAPQLLPSNGSGPDQVSPPRADEPVAKAGVTNAAGPILDARKGNTLEKIVNQGAVQVPQRPPKDPIITPPLDPIVVGPDQGPGTPTPVEPPPPPKQLVWGRWQDIAAAPATINLEEQLRSDNTKVALRRNYAVFLTPGADYVVPERGSVGFNLKASEAYVYTDNGSLTTKADISNGTLTVDFGARTFKTGFDLSTSSGELFKMAAEGVVGHSGRLTGNELWKAPTNMNVEGQLSNENGGAAAYIFDRRLDDGRTVNGGTYWGVQK